MSQDRYKKTLAATGKQAGLVFVYRSMGYLLGFVAQAAIARLLGADSYGLFSLGMSITQVGMLIAIFGMQQGLSRFLGQYNGRREYGRSRVVVRTAFTTGMVLAAALAAVLLVFGPGIAGGLFHEPRLVPILPWFALILAFSIANQLLTAAFRGFKKPSVAMFCNEVLRRSLRLALFGLLYLAGFRLLGIVLATVLAWAVGAAVLALRFRTLGRGRPHQEITPALRTATARKFLRFSTGMFFITATGFFRNQVNRLLVGVFLLSKDVGLFTAAMSVSKLATFFLQATNTIFAPTIAELYHSGDHEMLEALHRTVVRWVVSATLPLAIWFFLFAGEIMLVFGPDFVPAADVLRILAVGQVVSALSGPVGQLLAMTRHQRCVMANSALVAALNVTLNILLLPRLGITGSAIAGMVSLSAINILMMIQVKRLLNLQPFSRAYWKQGLAAALCTGLYLGLGALPLATPLLRALAALPLGYLLTGGLFLLLGFEKEDRYVLGLVKRRFTRATTPK
ncbi:MAG: flippase [Synergistales bacterium]|nr:flippase [Synergistales bacterium]